MGVSTLLYRLLTLAALLVLANGIRISTRRQIDCRKYVFAPRCRGVAAKRAPQDTAHFDDVLTSTDRENYILREALSARKFAESSRQARLLRALLVDLSRPSPVSHRHKYPQTDSELLMYLLSQYSKDDDFSTA